MMKKITSAPPRLLISLLLIGATLLTFGQVCRHEFLDYDDHTAVHENPYYHPVTVSNVLYFWRHPYFSLYMPATYTAWAGLATIARLPPPATGSSDTDRVNPHVFHTANLVVHVLNVLLVFAILRLLVKHDWAAAIGALLFCLHPVQTESVAWVTEMKGLLSGFFALLALWQYCLYIAPAAENSNLKRRHAHYALATLAFIFALLAKPSAVVVPLLAWALDWWMVRRPARQSLRPLLPWLAMAVLWVLLTRAVQPIEDKSVFTPLWTRPFIAGDALSFYLYQIVFPAHLAPHYGRTPEKVMQYAWVYLTGAVPFLALLLVWRLRRPRLTATTAIFVAALLPVLGLIPFSYQSYSTVADRYLYLAMLAPALGLACFLRRVQSKAAWGLCAMLLVLLCWRSAVQASYWKDMVTLFRYELRVNPDSWVAHTALGGIVDRQGKTQEALAHYRAALRVKPDYLQARNNLGLALANQGKLQAAVQEFQEVLRVNPRFGETLINLAATLDKQGKTEAAINAYRQALRLQPDSADLHANLGIVLNKAGQSGAAMVAFKEALRLDPRNAEAHNYLGIAAARAGNLAEAIEHLAEAVRLKPDYLEARYNFGGALMMGGNADGAVAQWSEALRIDPDYAPARQAMNAALGRSKNPAR